MITYCHFGVKQGQKILKIGTLANFGLGNSNMTLIFEIDNVFINYSYNVDTLSLGCQTRSENSESLYPGQFWVGEFKYDIRF